MATYTRSTKISTRQGPKSEENCKVPSLTKKPFVIDMCREKGKLVFPTRVTLDILIAFQPHSRVGSMLRSSWAPQNWLCICLGFFFLIFFCWFVYFDLLSLFVLVWKERKRIWSWVGRAGERLEGKNITIYCLNFLNKKNSWDIDWNFMDSED